MPDQGLTESDVRRWIGEASFGHGRRYFQRGHILNPRRQGETLKARCLGSRPQPDHVEVTLGQGGQLFIRVAQAAEESRLRAAHRGARAGQLRHGGHLPGARARSVPLPGGGENLAGPHRRPAGAEPPVAGPEG